MIAGLSGSLLSDEALERLVPDQLRGQLDESGRGAAWRRLRAWHAPLRVLLGPVSGPRVVFDRIAVPLFSQLGYRVVPVPVVRPDGSEPSLLSASLDADGRALAALVVTGWGQDGVFAWRHGVRHGIALNVRWCFCLTGPSLRIVDAVRTYSRRFLEFDLTAAMDNEHAFGAFWGLLRADAMRSAAGASVLDRAIAISEQHRSAVRSSLQDGVHDALAHLHHALSAAAPKRKRLSIEPHLLFDEALLIIYRVLFLLFAEARGLVPCWHPTYRNAYTIESLRRPVELFARPRGLWETLQSIARLAHRGCRIGTLRIPAFNGHLFSPLEAPLTNSVSLDEGAVRHALLALTTRSSNSGRQRISYGELGVEQLGAVYERLLDLRPPAAPATGRAPAPLKAWSRGERRKSTGSFYTPRTITEFLVRRTLAPLAQSASADEILALRVLDPAMGSGAFLVAACRYLAAAYESALLRERSINGEEINEQERARFRRTIAQRCLYGVDVNPTAVQLGRLSIWLATLSSDRPLTFLDHRLRIGNSLVGATPADLARRPRRRDRRPAAVPLFDEQGCDDPMREAIATREAIAHEPGDTLDQVRGKEQALRRLATTGGLSGWRRACDLWCAAAFAGSSELGRRACDLWPAMLDATFGRGTLPAHAVAPTVDELAAVAARERFFHWPLEFPEAFHGSPGGGFDAVVGNPPWEMLRGDGGDDNERAAAKSRAASLLAFARRSGTYQLQGDGHANLYQLFVERMLSLVRRGGRIGMVVPWGLAGDQGALHLRRRILEHTAVDTLISSDNRDRVFPIHRSVRFLLVCTTAARHTSPSLACHFGLRHVDALDRLADTPPDPDTIVIPRALIERSDPIASSIPDVRVQLDVDLFSQVVCTIPALGDASGWNVHFGRELNASDDRRHFRAEGARTRLPVIDGKHLSPFAVNTAASRRFIDEDCAARLLDRDRSFGRARIAYRDVASATNRLTLIAAIVPAGVVTTHTLFCMREPLDHHGQLFLCGMLNSLVANFVVRLRVTSHVTTAIVERLPMPLPTRTGEAFRHVVESCARLCSEPGSESDWAELQAWSAVAYGVTLPQFARVLATFPLVPASQRDRAYARFCDIVH